MRIQKKRQACLALFLCLPFISFAQSQCVAEGDITPASVSRVVDGDTVYLTDGRKVRLVGVNTPELDHKHGHHEAFAVAAKQRLTQLAKDQVYWQPATDSEDRYGRKLYYLFTKDRVSLSAQLISEGLGYRIAVPPNLKYQDCLAQAEQEARHTQRGLWQAFPQWQPKAGFAVVQVKIESITHNRGGWWLETAQDLAINLPPYAEYNWSEKEVFFLQGKTVEARGWQYQRKKRHNDRFKAVVLTVKDPRDLRRIETPDTRRAP